MREAIEMIRDGLDQLRQTIRPKPRIGLGFAAGVAVGLAGAVAGIALAVATERRRRRLAGSEDSPDAIAAKSAEDALNGELDEELAQTFPASDPLPQSHRFD